MEGWLRALDLCQGELLRAWSRGEPLDRRPSPEQAVEAIRLAAVLAQDAGRPRRRARLLRLERLA
jgi:hypothetical protein